MRYLSVCSGIEAATVAWHPLGWTPAAFSEIEPFPRAVLAHHYPTVPCHGDFTTIGADEYGPIDLLVGGTPCQSFSVAGLRGGMDDERGQLALQFLKLLDRTRARWMVWENVPGVLSSNGGRDFGSFLGGLVELGYGFAYRVLDAQNFGVPQRRRRVFVVGHLGDWQRAAAVLFERHSLSGHPAPRREKGQRAAERTARSVAIRGRDGTPQAELGDEVANAILTPNGGRAGVGVGAILDEISPCLRAKANNSLRADTQAYVPVQSHCLNAGGMGRQDYETETLIAHSLRGEGFDASEDGTGRGTPLVPVAIQERAICENPDAGPDGVGVRDDGMAYTLEARSVPQAVAYQTSGNCGAWETGPNSHVVCFTAKDHGADASDIFPTLRSGSHSGSHANGGVMPAVAIPMDPRQLRRGGTLTNSGRSDNPRSGSPGTGIGEPGDPAYTLGQTEGWLSHGSAVRRLTPRECERLQGFPDDYTLVPYRGKPAADGPRYKALGNSMAVPVMRWIGERIALVEAISAERIAA